MPICKKLKPQRHLLFHCSMPLQNDAVALVWGASGHTDMHETRATARFAIPLQHSTSKYCCGSSLGHIFKRPFVTICAFLVKCNVRRFTWRHRNHRLELFDNFRLELFKFLDKNRRFQTCSGPPRRDSEKVRIEKVPTGSQLP